MRHCWHARKRAQEKEGEPLTHYDIFSSGFAQCGRSKHHGCELWFHKTLPFAYDATGRRITFSDFKVTIVASDPRWLMARLQGPFELYVLVAHAPCLTPDRPIDQIVGWWTALGNIISAVPSNALLVCAFDANAPLADTETRFFGQHHAEPLNRPGQAFQEFLTSQELFVPAHVHVAQWYQCHMATRGTSCRAFASKRLRCGQRAYVLRLSKSLVCFLTLTVGLATRIMSLLCCPFRDFLP